MPCPECEHLNCRDQAVYHGRCAGAYQLRSASHLREAVRAVWACPFGRAAVRLGVVAAGSLAVNALILGGLALRILLP